jgi:hypothetical protein
LFKDFSINGPLHTIILSLLKGSVENGWVDFDFTDPSKSEVLFSIVLELDKVLIEVRVYYYIHFCLYSKSFLFYDIRTERLLPSS